MSLSGHILPVHHGPGDGEALSSWLTRLAISHHLIPSIFFRASIRSQRDVFKQDIDIKCPKVVLQEVSVLTGKSMDVVKQTTFMPVQHCLYIHNEASTALPRWVGPAYIRKNTSHHFGLKICPECMRQSPYIRLLWRCTFFVVCPQHGVRLVDRCQKCGAPKSSRRLFPNVFGDYPDDALCFCHCCGWDYRQADLQCAGESEMHHVTMLLESLQKGIYRSSGLEVGYSHLFFAGLRLLMNGLFRLNDPLGYRLKKNFELEFQPIETIISLLNKSFYLIERWPTQFVDFSLTHSIGKSYWVRPRELAPYWLVSILGWYLNFEKYSASEKEVRSVTEWLHKNEVVATGKNVVGVLGGKCPPRNFHPLSNPTPLAKMKKFCDMTYIQIDERCLQRANTRFVALRTILYSFIYIYTPLKHVDIISLKFNINIINTHHFKAWLISIGHTKADDEFLRHFWKRYSQYVILRRTVDSLMCEQLLLSWRGRGMDESLAVKSLTRLLL